MPLRDTVVGPRSLLTFVRHELFGSVVQGFLTVGAFVGALGLYFAASELYRNLGNQLEVSPDTKLVSYLLWTYATSALAFAGWFSVYRKVQLVLDRERHQRALMARIHHEVAEMVRSAAIGHHAGGLEKLQEFTPVPTLLHGDLPRYLESKFGRKDISITVKYAVPGEDGRMKLKALFRRCCHNEHSRRAEMELDDSVVFHKFKQAGRVLQRIIICDTKALSTDPVIGEEDKLRNERYRAYGKSCGFRSVLAFPLRSPKTSEDPDLGEISTIRGFVSFDCPEPDAFEPLFAVPLFSARDNDGGHCGDTQDLNFFFGLADSLATLALLFDEESAKVESSGPSTAEASEHATA